MNKKKILLADDEPEVLDMLKIRLQPLGFDLLCAANGQEALDIAKKELPDIAVLDIMMPKMDGYDVCRNMKADKKTSHIPVIFLTVLGDPEEKEAGLEAGAEAFIQKPYEPSVFIEEIKKLLQKHSSEGKS
ncbi:MAG: response regulator [Candidatus Margulisiibacteriota bacterium]|nr:response regulator [Candidatus Margulisiibacteriota bacterium]